MEKRLDPKKSIMIGAHGEMEGFDIENPDQRVPVPMIRLTPPNPKARKKSSIGPVQDFEMSYVNGDFESTSVVGGLYSCSIFNTDREMLERLAPEQLTNMLIQLTREMNKMFDDGMRCADSELDRFRSQIQDVLDLLKRSYKRFKEMKMKTRLLEDLDKAAVDFAEAAMLLDRQCVTDIFVLKLSQSVGSLVKEDEVVPDSVVAFGAAIRRARERSE